MSTVIDKRVVEMDFNNENFEKNVKTSLGTLDKLKEKLQFKGSSDAFENLAESSGKLEKSASGLNSIFGNLQAKISALDAAKFALINRYVNQLCDSAERLVKSLTIEQISSGWDKYADKTSSVQTIMAATASQFEDTGVQMEYVNSQLERLNWFTDETSYAFTDMVNNIGKFTSNNVALDTATTAMQGIATWAAKSGANATEASRAMYNLSQAISVGALKLTDWKSIQLANMGTAEFKQTAIETAEALGTLTKVEEGLWKTTEGTEVSVKNFDGTLSDAWLSSEVLLKTLDKYGSFTNVLKDATDLTGISTTELIGDIEEFKAGTLDIDEAARGLDITSTELHGILTELSDDTYSFGMAAFKAAQESKTFADAINYTKDAASTAWMNIFEKIFGNYEQAKELWSAFSEDLYEIFIVPLEAIGDTIGEWNQLGGRDSFVQALSNIMTGLIQKIELVKQAFRDIFPATSAQRIVDLTQSFETFTERLIMDQETFDRVKKSLSSVFAVFDIIGTTIKSVINVGLRTLKAILGAINIDISGLSGNIADLILRFRSWVKSSEGVVGITDKIASVIERFVQRCKELYTSVLPQVQRFGTRVGNVLTNFWTSITNAFGGIELESGNFWQALQRLVLNIPTVFQKMRDGVSDALSDFSSDVDTVSNTVRNKLATFVENVKNIISSIDFGAIIATAFGASFVALMMKVIKLFEKFAAPAEEFAKLLGTVRNSIESFSKSMSRRNNTTSLRNIAVSIGILAASLAVLAYLPQERLLQGAAALTAVGAGFAILAKGLGNIGHIGETKSAAVLMLALSASILIMVKAVKGFADVNADFWGYIGCIAGVASLVAIMSGAAILISKFAPKLATGGVLMLSMASSILIMVQALKSLEKIRFETLGQQCLKMVALCGTLVILAKAMGKFAAEFALSTGVGVLAGVIGLRLLIGTISKFQDYDLENISKTLLSMSPIFVALLGVIAVTKLAGQYAARAGVTILAVSVGLLAISGCIKILAGIGEDALVRSAHVVAGIMAVMALLVASTKLAGSAFKTITALTIAITALAVTVTVMSMIKNTKGLVTAAAVVAGLIGMFALLVAATGKINKGVGVILVMTGAVALLAGVVYAMTKLTESEDVKNVGIGLGALVASLAAAFAAIGLLKSPSLKGVAILLASTSVVLALSGIIALINNLGWDISMSIENVASISTLIVALSAACILLGVVGKLGTAGLIGVLVLDALIASLGSIIVGLGALAANNPDMQQWVSTGIPMLIEICEGIGEAVGILVGTLVGSTIVVVMDSFAKGIERLGEALSNFSEDAKSFVDLLATNNTFSGLESLAEATLTLKKAKPKDIEKLGESLKNSADDFAVFAEKINAVSNATGFRLISEGIKMLAEAADAAPKDKKNYLPDFIESMAESSIGENLATISTNGLQIAQEGITAVGEALVTLATAAKEIPNDGGVWGDLAGDNNIGDFIKSMSDSFMAANLVSISATSRNIDISGIDQLADAITALAESAQNIPRMDGYWQNFVGEKSVVTFINQLYYHGIGDKLAEISVAASGIDAKAYANMADAITILSEAFTTFKSAQDLDFDKWVTQATSALKLSGYEGFKEAGSYIAGGLIVGVRLKKQEATQAMVDLASSMETAFRSATDVNSPSRLYRSIAEWIPKSLAIGIRKDKSATDASTQLGKDIEESLRDQLGIHSESPKFKEIASWIDKSLAAGITPTVSEAKAKASELGEEITTATAASIIRERKRLAGTVEESTSSVLEKGSAWLNSQIKKLGADGITSFSDVREKLGGLLDGYSDEYIQYFLDLGAIGEDGVEDATDKISTAISSNTSIEDALTEKIESIESTYKTLIDQFSNDIEKYDLLYQIWSDYNYNADDTTQGNTEAYYLRLQYREQEKQYKLAVEQYAAIAEAAGVESEEAQDAYNNMLQYKKKVSSLWKQINEIKDELGDAYEQEPISYEEAMDEYLEYFLQQNFTVDKIDQWVRQNYGDPETDFDLEARVAQIKSQLADAAGDDEATSDFEEAGEVLGSSLGEGVADGVESKQAETVNAASSTAAAAVATVTSYGSQMTSAGANLATSLASGITSQTSTVTGAVASLVAAATSAASSGSSSVQIVTGGSKSSSSSGGIVFLSNTSTKTASTTAGNVNGALKSTTTNNSTTKNNSSTFNFNQSFYSNKGTSAFDAYRSSQTLVAMLKASGKVSNA